MSKFCRSMAIIVPSGGLLLLTLGSLLLISNAVHTDEIKSTLDQQQAKLNQDDNLTPTTFPIMLLEGEKAGNITSQRRSARYFNQDGSRSQSDQQQQQQSQQQQQERSMSMESYAAALAAANSVADHSATDSADLVQSTIPANDAASFGEQPPASPVARQFETTEYSPAHSTSGSYYGSASAALPTSTSSATSYLPSYSSSSYHNYPPHSSSSYSNHHHHHQHQQQQQQHYQSAPSNYGHHHYGAASKKVSASLSPPLGYPSYDYWSGSPSYLADRNAAAYMSPHWAGSSLPHATSSGFGSSLMSSASSALSHWTGGFGIAEIVCGVIALSIGAVILGAPFFLIYLALMGNFSGSSTLSLTNPTATGPGAPGGPGTTTVNGRRKRLAIFEPATISNFINGDFDQSQLQLSALADSVIGQLSPFVDLGQVTATFKKLVDSIEKYSKMNQRPTKKVAAYVAAMPSASATEMENRKRRE